MICNHCGEKYDHDAGIRSVVGRAIVECPACGWDQPGTPNQLINLTPHAIHLVDNAGNPVLTVEASGTVARCASTREQLGNMLHTSGTWVPITHTGFGAVDGLPGPQEGIHYIVSSLVAQATRDRSDLLIPDDTVRDSEGRIIGCRALARV